MDGKVIKEESVSSPCSSSPLTNIVASGKENRRVGSPLNTSSEILTRSRSKGLSKENSHPHSRMSESPKVREGSSGSGHQSPPASNIRSHSSHSQGHGHSFGHAFSSPHSTSAIGNGMTSGSVTGGGTPSPPVNGSASTPNANSSGRTPSSTNSSGSSGGSGSSGSVHGSEGLGHGSSGRYVVKIKRFLGTLLHFGCDISPEVGDRVRSLVFNLVSGHLSIEEFHHSLQEVTSFPLRPFVLPFLRAHLPLLQREISHLARLAKQSPISYIRSHEQVIFEAGSSPGEPCDIFHSEAADIGLARKRKASESFYENGESGDSGYISTPKRHHASIFSPPFFITSSSAGTTGGSGGGGGGSSGGNTSGGSTAASSAADFRDYYPSAYPLLSTIHHAHGHSLHESGTSSGSSGLTPPNHTPGSSNGSILGKGAAGPEEEWKNIHVMLNCILSMVEKTKRALAILQNRTFHAEGVDGSGRGGSSSSADGGANAGASPSWLRRPHSAFAQMENSSEDFKRQASEMIAQALRATEDRVAEVKRRAEEAVQEVKRQALVELQRAEARACEVVAAERARLERVLLDSRRNPTESVIVGASLDSETCWNCGRKAHETCSGCNMARYCSAFCQHKDWENHHSACGRSNSSSSTSERATTGSGATGRESSGGGGGGGGSDSKNPHIIHENSNSSPINVSQPSPDNHSSGSNN